MKTLNCVCTLANYDRSRSFLRLPRFRSFQYRIATECKAEHLRRCFPEDPSAPCRARAFVFVYDFPEWIFTDR